MTFITAFADRYRHDNRVAYVQMGLFGLWGEHHLDAAAPYNGKNFPSAKDQADYIQAYLDGFGEGPEDVQCGISLDSTQPHGPFKLFPQLLGRRFHFFDDTLLERGHADPGNWRQGTLPTQAKLAQISFGMGGEFFWLGCNSNGGWSRAPFDCGNGESLSDQADRIQLNYVLGSPAVTNGKSTPQQVLAGSKSIGWELSVSSITISSRTEVMVTISNPGAAPVPFEARICVATSRTSGPSCASLSLLSPGSSEIVSVELQGASLPTIGEGSATLYLSLQIARQLSTQKSPLLSNIGISQVHRDLMINIFP